jgi:hypothetical protein
MRPWAETHFGAPPPISAQAADVDLVHVGAEPGGASTEAIVVKQNSALMGVAALKASPHTQNALSKAAYCGVSNPSGIRAPTFLLCLEARFISAARLNIGVF